MLTIDDRLSEETLHGVLDRLDVRDPDRADILAARTAMLSDAADRARVERAVEAILGLDGDFFAPALFTDADADHPLGFGVPLVLAFLATYEEAVTWRGTQPRELVDASLADLAQQLRVSRAVHGRLCLHAHDWVQANWAGGLVRLGRLQFTIEKMWLEVPGCPEGTPAYFVHIPEGGPLRPADVMASVAAALREMPQYYPQGASDDLYCGSWLLDPTVVRIAGTESNVGRFAARFTAPLAMVPNDRDPLYYAFQVEPPVDLSTLPRDSHLRRGLLEHYEAGGEFFTAMCRWVG